VATIKDISKYTGLALSTVSKYLNNGVVREKNKRKIEEALSVLDYRPNEAARSLKTNKSMTIGILIPNLRSAFDAAIISMIEEELTRAGYSVIICGYRKDPSLESAKLRFLLNKRVDGLVVIPSGVVHEELRTFQKENRPVVLIDRPLSGMDFDTVMIDNVASSMEVVGAFLEEGHRSIGIITGPEDVYTARMRLKGYLEAHKRAGVSIDYGLVRYCDWSLESGYSIAKELLMEKRGMTALIVCGDDMGLGALKAIQDESFRIPDDISLACFDLLQIAEILRPRLATVEQPVLEIGRLGAKLLLERLAGDTSPVPSAPHILKAVFNRRDSILRLN
jgi:alanine racemase/LacI family transcriptional regulator